MRIGELSRAAGIAPSAIRYYEQEGLMTPAERRGGRRVFDEGALDQLTVIRMAKDAGFSLVEIRRLVTEFGQSRWRRLAERKLTEVDALAQRLRSMSALLRKLLDCECPSLEICGRALRRHRCGPLESGPVTERGFGASRMPRERRPPARRRRAR